MLRWPWRRLTERWLACTTFAALGNGSRRTSGGLRMGDDVRTMHLFAGAGGGLLVDLLLGHEPVCAVEWLMGWPIEARLLALEVGK